MTALCIAKGCGPTRNAPEGASGPRTASHGLFCTSDYNRLERNLAETPAILDTCRRYFLTPGQGVSDGSQRTKGQPPIPINPTTLDAIDVMTFLLGSWTQLVCEERDLRGPDRFNDPNRTSAWLLGNLPWITAQMWCDDFEQEVRDGLRGLRGIVDRGGEFVTLELDCPYCHEQSLRARKDVSSDVTCRTEGCQDERGEVPRWTRQTWALLLSVAS